MQVDLENEEVDPEVNREVTTSTTVEIWTEHFFLKIKQATLYALAEKEQRVAKIKAKIKPLPNVREIPVDAWRRESDDIVTAALMEVDAL